MTTTDISRPRSARTYLRGTATAEERGATEQRRPSSKDCVAALSTSQPGHGLDFPLYYPPEVTEVVAIEPEPALRTEAEAAGERVRVAHESCRGVADALPLDEGTADIAVASLMLGSVPDQPAFAEIRRRSRAAATSRGTPPPRSCARDSTSSRSSASASARLPSVTHVLGVARRV
jgi:hypothetical protein